MGCQKNNDLNASYGVCCHRGRGALALRRDFENARRPKISIISKFIRFLRGVASASAEVNAEDGSVLARGEADRGFRVSSFPRLSLEFFRGVAQGLERLLWE